MESEGYYSLQRADSPVMAKMDIQMTTKLHPVRPGMLHVPCPYANNHEYWSYKRLLRKPEQKTGLALWMHNNCQANSGRQHVVQKIQQYMRVDSPGNCLHNYDPPTGQQRHSPVELLSQYKFYLSFENVFDDPDWVSSTFFRNLAAGTVPVYLGAPNIFKYAPSQRSIIRACDFDSAKALTDYLKYLDRNMTAYKEYLAWKETGALPEFKTMVSLHDTSVFCQLCMVAADHMRIQYNASVMAAVQRYKQTMAHIQDLNTYLDATRSLPCKGKVRWWKH
jgi:hypothetical protein